MCESYVQPYSKPCCSASVEQLEEARVRRVGKDGDAEGDRHRARAYRRDETGSEDHRAPALNYLPTSREQGSEPPAEPLLFGKFSTTLIGPGEAIVLPPEATHVDSEAELAVEIGRRGRRIDEDDALDFVAGYRCANDVSARNLQFADKQWTRGKGFDTFCPLGDRLVPVSELGDGSGLRVAAATERRAAPGREHRRPRLRRPPARRVRLGASARSSPAT